jgi:hypothetical protein
LASFNRVTYSSDSFVSAVFFGLNTVLIGIAVFIITDQSLLATGLMIFAFLSNPRFIFIHSMAWSEGPFITFTLIAFILLSIYIFRPRFYILIGVSISIGIAMATRYVGLTLIPPTIYVLLFTGDRPIKQKIRKLALIIFVASIPLSAWLFRNIITANTLTNRHLVIHMFGLSHAYQLLESLSDFVIPLDLPARIKVFLVIFIATLILILIAYLHRNNYKWPNAKTLSGILSIIFIAFFLTYISFIVISISLLDANITPSPRILSPAFIAIMIAILSFTKSLSVVLNKKILWHGFLLVVLIFSLANSTSAIATAININRNGAGYNSKEWKNSMTLNSLKFYDDDLQIYSNGPEVIKFQTTREASIFPLVIDPRTLKTNQSFDDQMRVICREMQNGQALMVYLDELSTKRWYFPTTKELEAKCTLSNLDQYEDGIIYSGQ